MDNISPIKDRILYFIKKIGITKTEFCSKTGMSYNNLKGKSLISEIGSDKIYDILTEYKDLSPEWLVTGNGKMLLSEYADGEIEQKNKDGEFLKKYISKLESENELLRIENERKQIIIEKFIDNKK